MERTSTGSTLPLATDTSQQIRVWQVLGLIGFIVMVVMNFLANWLPINGQTTGELSDRYSNLFVPAGLTFSIWGVIYLLLGLYTLYQLQSLTGSKKLDLNLVVHSVSGWYFFTCIFNAGWILAWHYELLPVSLSLMFLLLASLIRINFGLYNIQPYLGKMAGLLTKASFGLYLGWICIATIANFTAWLVAINWLRAGLGEATWSIIMIVLGSIIGLYTAFALANAYVALGIAWALLGIVIKRQESVPLDNSILYVAGVAALLLFLCALYLFFFSRKLQSQRNPVHTGTL